MVRHQAKINLIEDPAHNPDINPTGPPHVFGAKGLTTALLSAPKDVLEDASTVMRMIT